MTKRINHVRNRLNMPPTLSDARSIKQGLIDWIISDQVNIDELRPSVDVMKSMLGHIMCIDDNWTSLNTDHVNTSFKFWKAMHGMLQNQIDNKKFLLAKIQEATYEKADELARQTGIQKYEDIQEQKSMTPQPPMTENDPEQLPQESAQTPQPFKECSSLIDPPDELQEQIDSTSIISGKTSRSTKTVTFDGSANEKTTQTDSKICGKVILLSEYNIFNCMIEVHKKAITYNQRRRDAKRAEKDFIKSKHLVKVFKQLDDDQE